jgi:hypothetical protein
MMQLGLRFPAAVPDRIQEQFERFDAEHPEVYKYFEQATRDLIASGRKRVGAKRIIEYIRWDTGAGSTASERPYKINNNFVSRYVRKFITQHPELEPFIETRRIGLDRFHA